MKPISLPWFAVAIPLAIFVTTGCDSPRPQPSGQGIARVVQATTVKVAFTSQDNQGLIDDVLNGAAPKTFHWSLFELPLTASGALYGPDGIDFDLSDSSSQVRFSQVYRETCNPALQNFSPCWIYESYTSGDTGLSGKGNLRLTDVAATGSYQVVWQGITDRFGPPEQQYQHETDARIGATIVGETP